MESFTATMAVRKVISDFDTQMKLMRHLAPLAAAINKEALRRGSTVITAN